MKLAEQAFGLRPKYCKAWYPLCMNRCACLIIQNSQGEYLLQMRDDTPGITCPLQWDAFGGGIEGDEDPVIAASRELREELGIKVRPEDLEFVETLTVNGGEEHFVRLKHPLDWGDFVVREGAGAGFFTVPEMLKIPITAPVRSYFGKRD